MAGAPRGGGCVWLDLGEVLSALLTSPDGPPGIHCVGQARRTQMRPVLQMKVSLRQFLGRPGKWCPDTL